ncbi:hypothetical protein BO94DRAFT_277690 [Aspergillus sclerotioniger CBS 115572]|uniref:Uncharacterized protein n=1 Tax=Aspergillus sclerotioniger CBS 115572 TaxID=1450535 RepID=A0A317XA39_9EURO|nr:hypothetical protein BO94DRAFT_277690 [Aspergillus sclerotioniger CBS 115572]PWY94512.1 hypothetical protein BO94DRAFT_277690 [Aspergillus sclerotioniger CBS 115572]
MILLTPRTVAAGSYGCPIPDHLSQSTHLILLISHSTSPNNLATDTTTTTTPLIRPLTFYQFNMLVSGTCTCTIIILPLIFNLMHRHATHMSNPNEQLKYPFPLPSVPTNTNIPLPLGGGGKIYNLIHSYPILSFISFCFPNSYILPAGIHRGTL